MDLEAMNREELIRYINEMTEYMDNVIVFWGDKRELLETFRNVAENKDGEFTQQEAANAAIILGSDGAFDDFLQLLRDSFERGGINYVISEKISAIMEEVAVKHEQD